MSQGDVKTIAGHQNHNNDDVGILKQQNNCLKRPDLREVCVKYI